MKTFYFFTLILLLSACKPWSAEQSNTPSSLPPEKVTVEKDDLLDKADETGRVVWQQPERVINRLGEIKDLKIADIGAGSGYFTFRFALKGAEVLAIDIDPEMLKYIETVEQRLPEDIQENIQTRLCKTDDPLLQDEEVELAVIINTIGYIENRVEYLKRIRKGLKPGGRIMVLDFKTKQLSINAPPVELRVSLSQIEKDLVAAGFVGIISDDRTLNYQYLAFGEK